MIENKDLPLITETDEPNPEAHNEFEIGGGESGEYENQKSAH